MVLSFAWAPAAANGAAAAEPARKAMFPSARGAGAVGAGDTARGRAGRGSRGDLPAARPGQPRGKDVGGGAQEAVSQSQPGKGSSSRSRSGGRAPDGALPLMGGSLCARSRPPAARRSGFLDLRLLRWRHHPLAPRGAFPSALPPGPPFC